jgi:signal transduction histidine kinase/ligand-binding sensor domain-containing protein
LRPALTVSKISVVLVYRSVLKRLPALFHCACAMLLGLTHPDLRAASPSLPSYFTRILRAEDGLPHNAVTAITQTRDGYLWFGTYDGLARFDGASFTVFDNNNTPEMRSSRVISLFEDSEGRLWIGHEAGELTCYRDGKFYAREVDASWENRNINDIGSDQSGEIWLLNEKGMLARVNGGLISAPSAGNSTRMATLTRNADGELWVVYDGQVSRLEHGALSPVLPYSQEPGYVESVCASHDGGFWILGGGRIRKWNKHEWTDDLGSTPWDQTFITTVVETKSGCLAVGTLGQGLYLIFPHRGVIHLDRAAGFPHDWVRSLCEDREGTLWAGTGSGGLVALRAGKVATVNPPDQWQGRVVLSATTSRDGALWVGTEGAGLYRYFRDEWTHFGETNGLSNLFVWSVTEDSQGRIWAGTWRGGLFIQQGDRFEPPPGLENLTVATPAVLHARNGVTWIGTEEGLLRYEAGATKWYGRRAGLIQPEVRAVAEDRDGSVWFGMSGGGLGHLTDNAVWQYRKRDGLSSDYVQCLHFDADGALWIGTYGGGLNRYKQGRFTGLTTSQGLPNNFIQDIEEDAQGNFWMSSHGGIFRIARTNLNSCADGEVQTVRSLVYGKGDGMPTLECSGGLQPSGCKTADGRLWFPTSKGLVVLDPSDARSSRLIPPVRIEKMVVDGKLVPLPVDPGARLFIPPGGEQQFDFYYTALSFVAPEKVLFQYRLEDLDTGWRDAGTKRTINYTRIPPGDYTFRVKACNSDGVWNEIGAALSFTVQPYFWQTWWFRVLAGVAAATVLAGAVLIDARRRMHHKLERLERQRAIERERARIAQDIHDNLGANLTRISMLSQLAHGELDNPQHAATQLDRIYGTTRELTRAMDEIVWAVNPQHDTLDSLASYLGNFAQEFLGSLDVRCRLDMPLQLPAWPLTAEVRHNLFLAFKEAMNNVLKHADATEVYVSLVTGADAFTLVVRDNGVGFSLEAADGAGNARGNGLINMRQRLAKIGGRCEVQSAPGKGTEVKFVVPATVHAS